MAEDKFGFDADLLFTTWEELPRTKKKKKEPWL